MLYIIQPRQDVIDNDDKIVNCGAPLLAGHIHLPSPWKHVILFLSAAKAAFVPPVESNAVSNALLLWHFNSSTAPQTLCLNHQ